MGSNRAKTTHDEPDWEIVGKHPSGALLVVRVGGSGHAHKCCPRCARLNDLRGPLPGWLVENGDVLWCPDCGGMLISKRTPADDGVRAFSSVDGGKWHVLDQEQDAWLEAACKLRVRQDAAFVRAWGELERDEVCGRCLSVLRSTYGADGLGMIESDESASVRAI